MTTKTGCGARLEGGLAHKYAGMESDSSWVFRVDAKVMAGGAVDKILSGQTIHCNSNALVRPLRNTAIARNRATKAAEIAESAEITAAAELIVAAANNSSSRNDSSS